MTTTTNNKTIDEQLTFDDQVIEKNCWNHRQQSPWDPFPRRKYVQ